MLQSKWGKWKGEDVYTLQDILLPAGHLHSIRWIDGLSNITYIVNCYDNSTVITLIVY